MELTYEQIREKESQERAMHQWWTLISERERQDIVKGIPRCLEFGCTVTVQRLPEGGKTAVKEAYARHCKHVEMVEKALESPIRTMECAVCGEATKGRQWWNRDTGYGVCSKCIKWLRETKKSTGKPRESEEQIRDYYGMEGIHFNVS